MAAISTGTAVWEGDLASGSGRVSAESGAFTELPVSWARRNDRSTGTSPEELIASAHAACFCMALSGALARAGTPPTRLDVTAKVTFEKVGDAFSITRSVLTVRGTVPTIDATAFQKAAEGAKEGCPVSRALKGNVELAVTATLA